MSVLLADLCLPKACYVNFSGFRIPRRFDYIVPEDCTSFYPLAFADQVVAKFDYEEHVTLETYAQGSQLLHMRSSGLGSCSSPFFQLVCQIADLFAPSRTFSALTLRSAPPLGDTIGRHAVGLRALLSAFPGLLCLDTTAYDGTRDLLSLLGEAQKKTDLYHCPVLQEVRVQWRYQVIDPHVVDSESDWLWIGPLEAPDVPRRTGPQALSAFCDAIVGILKRRQGLALPLRMLSITVPPGEGGRSPSWTALVEKEKERLRGELSVVMVQDLVVSYVPGFRKKALYVT
ncbi:hypothetical protein C8T65DRAFT_743517 [Cerioporus squamosus]|nr:hypothetical protein C8T65DRAFT_743517 [Cerioporus squamosus]